MTAPSWQTNGPYPYAPLVMQDYLDSLYTPIWVATKMPAHSPRPAIVILGAQTSGAGNKTDQLSWRRVIIEVWHRNELDCGELAEKVRDDVVACKWARIGIRDVDVIGFGPMPDPATDSPRVVMTVDLMLRRPKRST
jgi:hypothetical protein